jgi:DNA-directed RNA polymerase specialized sigma24 family protein
MYESIDDSVTLTEEQIAIREAIDEMGDHPRKDPIGVKFRDVLEMRFYGQMTHQEIAEEMGWKDRRWTAVYLQRALDRLASALGIDRPTS